MSGVLMRNLAIVAVAAVLVLGGGRAWAHCDGLDGPVVTAARNALQSGDVARVLIWVRADDEAEIKAAFDQAMQVRKLGADARALADRYFFETLVRIHRAGEGAPYTGLKPAGRDLGPAIPAADEAIRTGSADALVRLLTGTMRDGLHEKFKAVTGRKDFAAKDVSAGRDYVESYVAFIHYVERLHEAAEHASAGHYPDAH